MFLSSLLRAFGAKRNPSGNQSPAPRFRLSQQPPGATRFRPMLEGLEDRAVPAVLSVTTALDVVDATDGVMSLREGITEAQNGDTVNFNGSLSGRTIVLTGGELSINKSLDIQGL